MIYSSQELYSLSMDALMIAFWYCSDYSALNCGHTADFQRYFKTLQVYRLEKLSDDSTSQLNLAILVSNQHKDCTG